MSKSEWWATMFNVVAVVFIFCAFLFWAWELMK